MSARTGLIAGLALGAGALVSGLPGCTDIGDSPLVWAPYEPPAANTCEVARKVFIPYCVSCHNGTAQDVDLRPEALAALANMTSPGYSPMLLVVPGDSASSLLYRKAVAPGPDDGDIMPPGGGIPDSAAAALKAWIDAGAPACEGEPVPLVFPGGPIAFGGPPAEFTAKRPTWAGSAECAPEQWWNLGDEGTSLMHPGHDCIDCHAREGDAPKFTFAGTIHGALTDMDDCRGAPGVKVEIFDTNGGLVTSATTNRAGNFMSKVAVPADGYTVRLSYGGRTREMRTVQTDGACNSCHGPVGTNDAPGRVVVP